MRLLLVLLMSGCFGVWQPRESEAMDNTWNDALTYAAPAGMDLLSTHLAENNGYQEANPLMQGPMGRAALLKAAQVAALTAGTAGVRKWLGDGAAKTFKTGAVAASLIPVAVNLVHALGKRR